MAALLISALLAGAEVRRWARGTERRQFSVEPGIGDVMQVNVDVVVAMHCDDVHVNVQDAAGDLVLAGSVLQRDETSWAQWRGAKGIHSLERHHHRHHQPHHGDGDARPHGDTHHAGSHGEDHGHGDSHVHDADYDGYDGIDDDEDGDEDSDEDYIEEVSALVGALAKKSFPKTPRLKRGAVADACRIYGSMELNKVQGDFHITARGHGYAEWGAEHLDHSGIFFHYFDYFGEGGELREAAKRLLLYCARFCIDSPFFFLEQHSTSRTSSTNCLSDPTTPRCTTRSTRR